MKINYKKLKKINRNNIKEMHNIKNRFKQQIADTIYFLSEFFTAIYTMTLGLLGAIIILLTIPFTPILYIIKLLFLPIYYNIRLRRRMKKDPEYYKSLFYKHREEINWIDF